LAGAAFGSGLGSMFGSSRNYAKEAGALGGAIGGAFGPVWGLVGSAAGTLIGSLIKKGADEALSTLTFAHGGTLTSTVDKVEGKLRGEIEKLNSAITDSINSALELLGGSGFAGT